MSYKFSLEISSDISEDEFKNITKILSSDKDSDTKFKEIKPYLHIDKCTVVANGLSHHKKEVYCKIKNKSKS
jgi:hypothetical protein